MVVEPTGSLQPNFVAGHDSVVQIQGGTVGDNFEADQSQVTISAGAVGNRMDVFKGATVALMGGSIGDEFEVFTGGELYIQGGATGKLGKAIGGRVILSGGSLGSGFDALANSVINISGGSVNSGFFADNGSIVNVLGGEIETGFEFGTGSRANIAGGHMRDLRSRAGSTIAISGGNIDNFDSAATATIDISGGAFGDNFDIIGTAVATFTGTEFALDGVPIAGLDTPGSQTTNTLPSSKTFTGLFADGTPFAFRTTESDAINNLKLIRSSDLSPGASTIDVSSSSAFSGIRANQTLTLHANGSLPINFNAGSGSRLDIVGGTVASNFEAYSAPVNISSGAIGAEMDAFGFSTINISGGTIGTNFDVYDQSTVNMTGGQVTRLDALAGSTVNVNGGYLVSVQQSTGSATHWRGGTISSISTAGTTPSLYMYGASFEVNGVAVAGLVNEGDSESLNVPAGATLTAVMSDGTPVVLVVSQIANGTLRLVRSSPPSVLLPTFQQISAGSAPQTVGSGQTLLISGAGQLPANFVAGPGSTLDLQGSASGSSLTAFGANLNIAGGTITSLQALKGTSLHVTGGTIASALRLFSGAEAEIYGGKLPSSYYLDANTTVDIYAKTFLLNNLPIAGLQMLGDVLVMSQRGGQTLTAILTDGSTLSWRLTLASQRDFTGISGQATLRLHVAVPEPTHESLVAVAAILACCSFRRRVCPSALNT